MTTDERAKHVYECAIAFQKIDCPCKPEALRDVWLATWSVLWKMTITDHSPEVWAYENLAEMHFRLIEQTL